MANAFTDYTKNKILDWFFRGQTFTPPASLYVALLTSTSPVTEVTGGSYARVSFASSLADWSGTQGAGTTVASSGTGGQISNNVAITFPAPTANWGTIVGFGIYDAVSGGNLLMTATLTVSKTVNSGDAAPSFAAAALTYTLG